MKELIRMNQIAGTITEGQARKMLAILNENMGSTPEKKRMLLSKIKNLVPGQEREFLVFMAESANSYEDYSKSTVSELLDGFIEFEEGENGEALTPEIMDEVLETYIEGFESGDGTF